MSNPKWKPHSNNILITLGDDEVEITSNTPDGTRFKMSGDIVYKFGPYLLKEEELTEEQKLIVEERILLDA